MSTAARRHRLLRSVLALLAARGGRAARDGDAAAGTAVAAGSSDYSDCTAIAAELEFARLEIAALQHDNAVLASENRILANERNLPEVVSDIREYIRHVLDGDDVVPCREEEPA